MKVNSDVTNALRIGELAARTGVPTHRLRHYEDRGLLCSFRAANGYRYFAEEAVIAVARIATLLHAGLNLDEVAEVLEQTDGPDSAALDERAKEVLRARAMLLEVQISCMASAKRALERIADEGEILPIEQYDACGVRMQPFNLISRPH
ncbi:MerR family transcriptional regulator [Epidermidibacterium keratini]|uniref:MerR family transcriptional regulator n=1 Tax=Epidermidibacterium keratini TaxID=1891644 RepID=A0A7L4YMG9_9ACTN|nr:MerR family transcriptional regulator [Epidermidibacterium keratini]QHC00024.1 MerR family transcriptional regulator [Epidermidibacterium keratini]